MSLHLTHEFLNDLRSTKDARLVRDVLNHTIATDGNFTDSRDDHRFDGIEDAWIRYASRGRTAYRVIYIRKGANVFLHRAGMHSVEEAVKAPKNLADAIQLVASPLTENSEINKTVANTQFFKTSEAAFIGRHIESMYHVRHNEIYLVSPFIDLDLLESRHKFGRFLDRAIEENTVVVLITASGQDEARLPAFKDLDARGINVYFLTRLHTKLYMFDIDLASRNAWQQGVESHVIIGSSNLTNAGLGINDGQFNEELNCGLGGNILDEARTYVHKLIVAADDYQKYAFKLARSRRGI